MDSRSPGGESFFKHADMSPSTGETDKSDKYPDYCRTIKVQDSHGAVKELVFPKALDLDRPKRARTTFSPEQLYQLEREFQKNQYLVGKERTDLARRLRLSETQVKVWFQNRRTKYKRDRSRDAEVRDSKAESFAACNILRMLQHEVPASYSACAPVNSFFPSYNPYAYAGYSPTWGFFRSEKQEVFTMWISAVLFILVIDVDLFGNKVLVFMFRFLIRCLPLLSVNAWLYLSVIW